MVERPNMASSRRKQDEKNLKTLRELGSQPSNRTCFDCHQRGTTYINMTVGSFVCTSCSGILRGLNPPHRVKSISMASFTQEEIEQIKSKGNQYCGAVWLGLYDAKLNPFPDTKDEHKIRDFMIMKYEKKRFFIDPSVALKNMPPQNSSATSSNASTPSSETCKAGPAANSSVSRPNVSNSQSSGSVSGALTSATSTGSKNSTPKSSTSLDLLADLGTQPNSKVNSNDPFASPTSSQAPTSISQPSFANFENANIFTNTSDHLSKTEPDSTCHTLMDQSHNLAIPPLSLPPTRSPSPRISPGRISNWEAFEGEEANAGTPLIPIAESYPSPATVCYDTTGRATNKGRNIPSMKFASGVSAQFVYPTNSNFEACVKEEATVSSTSGKQSYNSSTISCESDWHSSEPISGLRDSSPKVAKNVLASHLQLENRQSHNSPFHSQKLAHCSRVHDNVTCSALNIDSSHSRTVTSVLHADDKCENHENSPNYFHLNAKSNEISSECFDAFLSSSSSLSKVTGASFQNIGSGTGHLTSKSTKETELNILDDEFGSKNMGMVSNLISTLVGHDKTNPFVIDSASPAFTDENTIFDNIPLFPKKKIEATNPVSVNSTSINSSSSLSSSCPIVCPPCAPSGTNPFVSVLQPDTNAQESLLSVSNAAGRVGNFSCYSSSDLFMHESLSEQRQPFHNFLDNSMTSSTYILAGSTSSNKSTPMGPHLPFSSNPLTPMAPGSSSNPSSSSVNNTQSASSNNPAQDRYAALKDLDEEFKTQKESETVSTNGGGSWPIPNGSHQNSSAVFGSSSSTMNGTVFGSPGTSTSVFGAVNGGSSGGISGGAFGTPPNTSNAWANFSGANPFSGCNNGAAAAWINGGSSLGSAAHTQQGFGSVVQPNPFGTTPDPNFNQFGNSAPLNGTSSTNNGAWANFSQHPQNSKLQWMTSNGTANPFMATPQMPSSGTSYNPFL
ncbi:uncharacterized protein [Panulirus ornatus]|uniref:uncharacterized protein isoform X2 n=1 Tax=Panulirus ornatus TaxID=150431 RepID=UPI003A83854A